MLTTETPITRSQVSETLKRGSRIIAPLWSLENYVAVNSYMGMADMSFGRAMDFLHKSADTAGTLSVSYYLEAITNGQISYADLKQAIQNNNFGLQDSANELIENLSKDEGDQEPIVRTFADVASRHIGKKWNRFMIDRISFWASAYFDDNQALWSTANKKGSLFTAWKQEAEIDLATEAMGLKGFRSLLKTIPDNYLDAVALALDELEIPEEIMDFYLSSLLMKMNGWAGYTARIDWEASLQQQESQALQEFLAIMIVWDMSLKKLLGNTELEQSWRRTKTENILMLDSQWVDEELARRLILQQAYDLSHQRLLIQKINDQDKGIGVKHPTTKFQAVFCIDVRSEVLRRNIEAVNSEVETLGFAGFFGFPVTYVPLGHEEGSNQCPVLLRPVYKVNECIPQSEVLEKAVNRRRRRGHLQKALKVFKKGAVSCFGFVSPLGLYFLPKLLSDSLGLSRPVAQPDKIGLKKKEIALKGVDLVHEAQKQTSGIPLEDRISMGLSALKGMSLTENFAEIVLIAGHGSSTTNNPHATGLDCGACGGNSGEANARVAATILNNPSVRAGIREKGVDIPDSTLFVAALHNTTTDEVEIMAAKAFYKTPKHEAYLKELKMSLAIAGERTRLERSSRMNLSSGDIDKQVIKRSKDWSQVRPEWGLAGCSSFIVAPRSRTAQLDLAGKSFLHNYSWRNDKDFSVLELIMTAPMVVTSWINLQYYASTVDNKVFGAGNKTLHNVVAGMGVLEGFAGDLRVGLPMQSVNDGEKFQHEPLRLKVFIEAPVDEMSKILEKHESIRSLCDNQWIYLYAINEEGKVAFKYDRNLEWEVV